jgi:hypothetical protein
MADELGGLEKEIALAMAPFEKKLPRIKALKEALQLACPTKPAEEWIVEGEKFGVRLGPRANERLINYKKLLKAISVTAFVKFATCTLAALEKHVAPYVIKSVITSDATGPRKLSTFEKGVIA